MIGGARWSRNKNFHSRLCRLENSLFVSIKETSRISGGDVRRPVPTNNILLSMESLEKLTLTFEEGIIFSTSTFSPIHAEDNENQGKMNFLLFMYNLRKLTKVSSELYFIIFSI